MHAAGYSADSDYASDLNFPVGGGGGMQANAPASQYIQVNRKTANIPLIRKPLNYFLFQKQVASDMQTAQPYFDQSQQQQGYYNQVSRIFFHGRFECSTKPTFI